MKDNIVKGLNALFKISGVDKTQIAKKLNLNRQSFYNKLSRGSFPATFFFELVDLLGGLVVIEYEGARIEFREDGVYLIEAEKAL